MSKPRAKNWQPGMSMHRVYDSPRQTGFFFKGKFLFPLILCRNVGVGCVSMCVCVCDNKRKVILRVIKNFRGVVLNRTNQLQPMED